MDKKVLVVNSKDERTVKNSERNPLVMVVENDPDTMLLISVLLRTLGYSVIEASNGEKALKLLGRYSPEIIFMDVNMPVMDGYTATRHIRQMPDPYCSIPLLPWWQMPGEQIMKNAGQRAWMIIFQNPFGLKKFREN